MRLALVQLVALALAGVVGCGGSPPVVRVLSGELVTGRFIPSDAYTAFLSGVLAEQAGKLDEAALAYRAATKRDARSAEVWARLGTVLCRQREIEDGRAAAERARSLDPMNATVESAHAACDDAEGDSQGSAAALARAARLEPRQADLVRELAERDLRAGRTAEARSRLEAWLLEPHTDPSIRMAAAELALRAGQTSHAIDLAVSAVALSSMHAQGAARLCMDMAVRSPADARRLAASLVDLAPVGPGGAGRVATTLAKDPLVFRLAIDDALLRGDDRKALARATKGSVAIAEVVGRAIVLGAVEPARAMLLPLEQASPAAASIARVALGDAAVARRPSTEVPSALMLALTLRARQALDREAMLAFAAAIPAPIVDPHDLVLVRAASVAASALEIAPVRQPPL